MTRFLLATDSVHTSAAACDYLDGRLAAEDAVTVLAVTEGDVDARDGDDALNVAAVRLSALASVETTRVEGDAADAILEFAADGDVDEIVVGSGRGTPGTATYLGGTARTVVARAGVPAVVVPLSRLD